MRSLSDCILVMVGCIQYDGLMQRHQHLAREMSKYLQVVYVEETPSRIRRIMNGHPFDPALKGHKLGLRELGKDLYHFKAPPCVPRQLGYRRSLEGTAKRGAGSLRPHLPKDKPVILWLFSPYSLGAIGLYDEILSVFDCFDAFGEFPGEEKDRDTIQEIAFEAAAKVDLVVATNHELRDQLGKYNSNSVIVQNGCDPVHFKSGGNDPSKEGKAVDMDSISKPVIGYMGDISAWLDLELLLETASRHPDWSIVLLGPWKRDKPDPRKFPNVYTPGRVPYDELPYYARRFDVGTIPFVMNNLTRVVNPLKLYEYFAMGKPVVATPLPEITRYEDLVYVVRSPDEFVGLTELAVKEAVDSLARGKRMNVAEENSWEARGETVVKLLEDLLANLPKMEATGR